MYIDNPKKLFEDLINIDTIYSYMAAIEDDGNSNNLSELISVIYNEKDQVFDGTSSRWDIELGNKQQILKDNKLVNVIWNIIQRELNSKYILVCENCGKEYFYNKKPKYSLDRYKCSECKAENSLQLLPFEQWASPEIMNLRSRYVHR